MADIEDQIEAIVDDRSYELVITTYSGDQHRAPHWPKLSDEDFLALEPKGTGTVNLIEKDRIESVEIKQEGG